jgi:hypothetical protein
MDAPSDTDSSTEEQALEALYILAEANVNECRKKLSIAPARLDYRHGRGEGPT